jgi:adenosylcobinamide-GDP ribazoletransferase
VNALRSELRTLAGTVLFFTRLPLPRGIGVVAADLRCAITYFPLCGALVGGFAALAWWLASLVWPSAVAAGVALVAGVVFTGALHEDGWADVCDGFGGGHTKERILEIMKDSHSGAYGVLGLVLLVGLKWQTLAALPGALVPAALVAGHALSRGMAATLMATLDYARPEGPSKARALVVRLGGWRLIFVLATALAPVALLPVRAWWGVAALVAVRFAAARWFKSRIGGYTGDCLGAAQQLAEAVFYLVVLGVVA